MPADKAVDRIDEILRIRRSNSLSPVIAFHGCKKSVAETLLKIGAWNPDKDWWKPSTRSYDWLGSGMYFWIDSPQRAYEWSKLSQARAKASSAAPGLVGALLNPGLCLNLMDAGVIDELHQAFSYLKVIRKAAGMPLPENGLNDPQGMPLLRKLDCEVIQTVHQLRADKGEQPYDSVMGFFEEGSMAFEGSSIRAHTHVQIAVRNPEAIVGFFRVV
jgi:hypothetical protein